VAELIEGCAAERSPTGSAVVPISYIDDVVSAFRDHRTGRFVALPKMMTPVLGRSRRTIYLSSSRDFREWMKLAPAFVADRRDDLGSLPRIERSRSLLHHSDNPNVFRTEFYGAGAYSAESCVIGFPWVFTINASTRGNQEGPIEPQLAVSRDLEHWQRPFRTPILRLGKPGVSDGGMIVKQNSPPYQNVHRGLRGGINSGPRLSTSHSECIRVIDVLLRKGVESSRPSR